MKLAYVACIAFGLGIGMAHAASIDCQAVSTRFLDHLDKGDYTGAIADFDDRMKAGLSADKLASVWQAIPKQLGTRGAREPAQLSRVPGYAVVATPMHYGKDLIDAQVACDADDRIAGFHLVPHP